MATQAFLDEARRLDSAMVALIKVYLTSPTTRTLYLAPSDISTPDFQTWEPVIVDYDAIQEPGSTLSTGPDLCAAGFTLAARATLGFQADPAKNLTDLFVGFRWIGAKVEIYLWPFRLTSFGDAHLRFVGIVSDYQVGPDKIDVWCTQRMDWEKPVSSIEVARDLFPRAPDRSVGLPLPIVYGKIGTPPLRQPPWAAEYDTALHDIEHIGGVPVGIPVVCVDTGRGGSSRARYMVAGHKVTSHNVPARATTYSLRDSGLLVPIEPSTFTVPSCTGTAFSKTVTTSDDYLARGVRVGMPMAGTNVPAGAVVESVAAGTLNMSIAAGSSAPTGTMTFVATFNDANGAGYELADDFNGASFPVTPSEVLSGVANPADDLRYALDPFNEVSFAKFVYDGGAGIDKRRGEWRLPDASTPGDFALGMFVRVLYKSSSSLSNFYVGIRRLSDSSETRATLSASTTPTRASISVGGVEWGNGSLPTTPWGLSEIVLIARWDPTPGSRQDVWIYAIGLEVQYRPKARIYAPSQVLRPRRLRRRGDEDAVGLFVPEVLSTPDTEIESDFFGTIEGIADPDGSYTAAGADTLIELGPDIAHHALRTYGGQTAGQIQTAGGTLGSFVDARADLKTWRGTDCKCAIQIAKTDVLEVLRELAGASLCWFHIDPSTDKWHCVPWRIGSGRDYSRGVYRDDLIDLQVQSIKASRVPSGVKVSYTWDGNTRRFLNSTTCGLTNSKAGHRFMDIRDENLTVVNDVNDRVPFAVSGFSGAADIATGAKADLHALAAAVDAALETAAGAHDFMVCHSNRIVTGYNDKINFNDGAVKVGTLGAGTYTMEELALAVQVAMNAVSGSWIVSYSRATRKFTIDRSSGTKTLLCSTGANKATTIFANLGYTSVADVTGGTAGSFEVEEDRLIIECLTSAMDLLWASGTNGTATTTPKCAAELCGFAGTYDRDAAGARRWWISDSPKGPREQTLAAGGAAYGFTREITVEAKAIADTDTARELRNRMIDWLKEPRIIVRFITSRMPDVRRGELVRFDDLDEFGIRFPKQGSDGLWTGRRFRVLQIWQRLGDSFDQEIECIEND